MARSYHVDGPCTISVGTGSGSPAALEVLGIAESGVDLEINEQLRPVHTSVSGPLVPADLQRMGADAWIRAALIDYDLSILTKIRRKGDQTDAADGKMPSGGSLIGSGGNAFRVVIASADEVWRFTTCVLRGSQSTRMGTVMKTWNVVFYSWPYLAAGSSSLKDAVLYDHTNS